MGSSASAPGNVPIVGLTTEPVILPGSLYDGQMSQRLNYGETVVRAGGAPVLLPPTLEPEVAFELIDALVFPGGRDLDASLYGKPHHPKMTLQNPIRYEYEKRLLEAAPKDLPILGICYGAQALNVFFGGSLHPHLPDVFPEHAHDTGDDQEYRVDPNSRLAAILGRRDAVGHSHHHQGIDQVAPGFVACAWHEDGLVEAIEIDDPDRWVFGVQWHPERTIGKGTTEALFDELIRAARAYRQRRMERKAVEVSG